MGLVDDIKREKQGITLTQSSTESLIIEQKLGKLFYLETNVKEEAKFVEMIMLRDGIAKERVGLHASAIIVSDHEFCFREQVLSLVYKQSQGSNISPGLKRIFAEGNSIHEKWQRLMLRGKLGTTEDMDRSRMVEKYKLSYTPDGANIKIGQHEYIVEIKSVNTFQYKKLTSHPSGKKQLMLYMYLTGIHKGFVLCEDKNTQEFKIFLYDYDEEVVTPYIERLEAVKYYLKRLKNEHKMVKGICGSPTCKRALKCNLKDACWNCGHGRVKL